MSSPYTPWTGHIGFSAGAGREVSVSSSLVLPNVQVIPLDSSPNHVFQATLLVDGQNIRLQFGVSFNAIAGYWSMTLKDPATGIIILDSIPLITGQYPAANILAQYGYLGIGSAYVLPASNVSIDYPDEVTLGSDFVLVWGDTK